MDPPSQGLRRDRLANRREGKAKFRHRDTKAAEQEHLANARLFPVCPWHIGLNVVRVSSRSFAVDSFICVYLRSSAVVCLPFLPIGRIETFDRLNESLFHRRIGKVCGPYAAFQGVRCIEGDQFPAID
jgi:hypothetical protein